MSPSKACNPYWPAPQWQCNVIAKHASALKYRSMDTLDYMQLLFHLHMTLLSVVLAGVVG